MRCARPRARAARSRCRWASARPPRLQKVRAEDVAQRHRRAARHQRARRRGLHRALRSLRHARAAPGEPRTRTASSTAPRQRLGRRGPARDRAGDGARRRSRARSMLLRLHDGGRIGTARRRVLRAASDPADGADGREHQRRRLNLLGPTKDIVLLGAERSTLGPHRRRRSRRTHGRVVGQDPEPERGYFFRSDHFPLAKGGVPARVDQRAEGRSPGHAPRIC